MARIKRGVTTKRKHKKLHELTKGYRMTKSRLVRVAKEASLHAGEYAFHGRKLRKREMRKQWIMRINSQLQQMDLHYNQFINSLKKSNIQIDRKMLADLAIEDPEIFKVIVDQATSKAN